MNRYKIIASKDGCGGENYYVYRRIFLFYLIPMWYCLNEYFPKEKKEQAERLIEQDKIRDSKPEVTYHE